MATCLITIKPSQPIQYSITSYVIGNFSMCKVQIESLIPLERNQAMQHTKAEGCAKKGEIQKFHLHSSSSNEEFLAQDPICN